MSKKTDAARSKLKLDKQTVRRLDALKLDALANVAGGDLPVTTWTTRRTTNL